MKILMVRQPWASLIAAGQKTIELRTWLTHYRGELLICAGSKVRRGTSFELGPRGVTLCLVELADIRPARAADAKAACCKPEPNEFAWILQRIRSVPQVPFKGALGLRDADRELLKRLGI